MVDIEPLKEQVDNRSISPILERFMKSSEEFVIYIYIYINIYIYIYIGMCRVECEKN